MSTLKEEWIEQFVEGLEANKEWARNDSDAAKKNCKEQLAEVAEYQSTKHIAGYWQARLLNNTDLIGEMEIFFSVAIASGYTEKQILKAIKSLGRSN